MESHEEPNWNDSASDNWSTADPWETGGSGQPGDGDNWLLGYVDVLTLMLTLMVLLLAFNQIQHRQSESKPKIEDSLKTETIVHRTQAKIATRSKNSAPLRPQAAKKKISPRLAATPSRTENPPREIQPTTKPNNGKAKTEPATKSSPASLFSLSLESLDLSLFPQELAKLKLRWPQVNTDAVAAQETEQAASDPREADRKSDLSDNADAFQRVIEQQHLQGLIEVSQARNALRMEVNEDILFATGKAELKPSGKKLLDELAGVFREQPGSIHVEGHTDNVPIATHRFPSNWELSASRASTVARNLIHQGIRSDRLRAIGYADTKPRETNTTVQGRSKNRRVSLVIEFEDTNT